MVDYLWKALLTEFLGTFTLVFVGAGAVALSADQGASIVGSALAFGLTFIALFYAWGVYSGAHFNPAVSFGFAVAGRMHWGLMIGYWIAQILGAIAAAALIAYIFGTANGAGASIGSLTNTDVWKAILLEAILTFFLVITFLLVTRNPFVALLSGVAIGAILAADILAGSPLTGASMNPARSLGPALFSNNLGTIWIYIVGPLAGALLAGIVYKLFTIDWSCCDATDECGNVICDPCGNPLKECSRPVVDPCGNPVRDECGDVQYEKYTRVERQIDHHQQTLLGAIGGWMGAHGADPRYIMQELDRAGVKEMVGDKWRDAQHELKEMQHARHGDEYSHHGDHHHDGDHLSATYKETKHIDKVYKEHVHMDIPSDGSPASYSSTSYSSSPLESGERVMSMPENVGRTVTQGLSTLSPSSIFS